MATEFKMLGNKQFMPAKDKSWLHIWAWNNEIEVDTFSHDEKRMQTINITPREARKLASLLLQFADRAEFGED